MSCMSRNSRSRDQRSMSTSTRAGLSGILAVLALFGCGSSESQVLFDDAIAVTDSAVDDAVVRDSSGGADSGSGDTGTGDTGTPKVDAPATDTGGDSGPTSFRCKRGLAYGHNSVADLTALKPTVHWWYNWSPAPDDATIGSAFGGLGYEFAPMVWGGTFTESDIESKVPAGSKYLLGFNEPNFFSQANLTPTQAAALWPKVEAIAAAKGLKIVSPALNYCGGGCSVTNPYDYFDQFFAACKGCKIDAIAVHWYACTKSALVDYLSKFESKYGKPIWLTEFSCLDGSDTSVAVQQAYMKDALAVLEADPMVERYSWFSGRFPKTPSINLLGASGELTELGKLYVSLPETCK